MLKRALRVGGSSLGVVLLGVALWVLRRELAHYHYREIVQELQDLAWTQVALGALCTLLGYLVATGYDVLALRYAGQHLPYSTLAPVALTATAFSNSVGFSVLSGGSIRYQAYSAQGLSTVDSARIVGFISVSFWLGFSVAAGLAFTFFPPDIPASLGLPIPNVRPLGVLLLAGITGYSVAVLRRRVPFTLRGWQVDVPSPRLLLLQLLVPALDWALAAAALWVLLPAPGLGFPEFLGVFLLAQVAGVLSQVPGGLGIFETIMLVLLAPWYPAPPVVGALLLFRVLYYLLPLALAASVLGARELLRRRTLVTRLLGVTSRWMSVVLPHVFAAATFVSGMVLLLSGATPSIRSRLGTLVDVLPLGVTEVSHFLGSLVGLALLLVARGLQRRLDAAWLLAMVMLVAGALLSLLKGLDYEEATVLSLLALLLWPGRRHFYRRASLLHERFSAGWIAAVLLAVGTTTWLGFFAYKHVEYSHDLWWHFAVSGDAPRFLRASVGVVVALLVVASARLLSPSPGEPARPSPQDLEDVRALVARSPQTSAHLALLGDKSLLFNASRTAFLMYAHEGRSWVSMGEGVGAAAERAELAWQFRELSDRHDGLTVFYQVSPAALPLCLDLGLSLQKLGEEALVPLPSFTLSGNVNKGLRANHNRFQKDGFTLRMVPPPDVGALLPALKEVSDAWLAEKNTREKGFSLGYFDERYLRCCPLALVEHQGAVLAFANLWLGAEKEELSLDLMRFRPDAPRGVMDFLFTELMLWGQAQGYRSFNLGMAPFSGFEPRALAPAWARLAGLMYRHGEYFYNFQGLREYKEKFHPVWEPRYLACPGGLALPFVLANVAALVSRGLKGLVAR